MTLTRTQKPLASTFAVSALTMTGSYTVAGAVRSYHGSDYSEDYNNLRALRSCDREADSNRVKGVYDFDTTGGGNGEIEDTDGSNGNCASTGTSQNISRHRTCEKNHIAWDCDNYQNTSGKGPPRIRLRGPTASDQGIFVPQRASRPVVGPK